LIIEQIFARKFNLSTKNTPASLKSSGIFGKTATGSPTSGAWSKRLRRLGHLCVIKKPVSSWNLALLVRSFGKP
jgi:hypothetical protein